MFKIESVGSLAFLGTKSLTNIKIPGKSVDIARNKCPVRPDRIADRKTRCHSAIGFNYRLS